MEQRREEQWLNPNDLHFTDEYNPNVQDDATFNALVEQIEETGGLTENIVVVDHSDDPEWTFDHPYEVVSGNHRGKAAQVIGLESVPCRVYSFREWDGDFAKFQNVRHNVLKGKLDPEKFTKLYDQLATKYGKELTKDMMMFVDQKAFEKVYADTVKDLPESIRKKVDAAKDDIKTVDDLSNILNRLFSEYGDTLNYDFMVFDYGKRSHYWIRMDKDLKKKMEEVAAYVVVERISMNDFFKQLIIQHGQQVLETMPQVERPDTGDLSELEFESMA